MNSEPTINILDIGSGKILCLIVQSGSDNELEVVGYSYKETPISLLNRGNINNLDKVAKTIREVVNSAEIMAGIEAENFYVNVPGIITQGFRSHGLISITVKEDGEKKVSLSDVERVIDSAESTPIPKDHVVIHSIPIEFKVDGLKVEEDPLGMIGMRLETEVYLLTCPKSTLEMINKAVEIAGYHLQDIVSENIACAESVLSDEEKRSGCLMIDIGAQHTNAVMYTGNNVNMVFSIPWGGDTLTKDLAMGITTSLAEAEEIKKTHGVLDYQLVDEEKVITVKLIAYQKKTHISQKAVYQIIEARMTEIFDLVRKELRNHQATLSVGFCVVITGGTANIPGIETVGRGIFNQAVRVGYPLKVGGFDQNVINPSFATALGIAHVIADKNDAFHDESIQQNKEGMFKKIGISIKNFFN